MSDDLDDIIQLDQAYVERTYAERGERAPQIFKQGEYVIIKAEMSAGDERVIKNNSVRTSGKGKNVEMHVQIGDIELTTLQRMVRGWSIIKTITDPVSGATRPMQLPYSIANIEHLSRKVYSYVRAEIARLNPDEDEEVDERGEHPLSLHVIDSFEDREAVRTYRQK
jgi:hypothetical protein